MSDEELLEQAESYLEEIRGKTVDDPRNRVIVNGLLQASIAASLLVIARNSVAIEVASVYSPPPPSSIDPNGGF